MQPVGQARRATIGYLVYKIRAYGFKQRNPSEKIREEGYEWKSSEWKDLSGGIWAEGSKGRHPSG